MSRVFVVRGSLPTHALQPGRTLNRFVYRRYAEAQRGEFCGLAAVHHSPKVARFTLTYRFCPPSRLWLKQFGKVVKRNDKPYCARDDDNARSSAKHAVDGLTLGGLILDDSRKCLAWSKVEVLPAERTGPGWLELVVTEVTED